MDSYRFPQNTRKIALNLQRVLGVVALVAIAAYLLAHRRDVIGIYDTADPVFIGIAVLIMAVLHVVICIGFHHIYLGLGMRRTFAAATDSYFSRLPARYIPGGIWHSASRYMDIHAHTPVSRSSVFELFVAENGLTAATGLTLMGIAAIYLLCCARLPFYLGVFAVVSGATVGLALCAGTRFRRLRIDLRHIFIATMFLAINWIGICAAFAIYAGSMFHSSAPSCSSAVTGSTYGLSAAFGFAAFFAPQGWGITEFFFTTQRICSQTTTESLAVVAGFRLVGLIADLTAFVAWIALQRIAKRTLQMRSKKDR